MHIKKQFLIGQYYFDIEVGDSYEYQPGVDTWLFDFQINNTNVTDKYTSKPYLSKKLDKWQMLSVGENFLFLPLEAGTILIDTRTLKPYKIPSRHYRGNCFTSNRLFVYGRNLVLVTDLESKYSVYYFLEDDVIINDVTVIDDNNLSIFCHKGLEDPKVVTFNIEHQTLK